ncbi:MAG: hypothetical protein H8E34_06030, partial [Bacteroidetes bacterium]|nr:hypothetical protein [Bacteroidota bacterium]
MMSRRYTINLTALLSAILFIIYFSFSSCKKVPDPSEGKIDKDTINFNLLKSSIFIQFFDANTNELIIPVESEALKVNIIGQSKDAVADIIGFQKSEYNIRKGTITFGLIPNAEFVPTSISPVRFTIIAQLHGYLTSTKEVTITSEGDYILKVFMVNKDNPPPGVIIARLYDVGNLVNGVLQDTASIATTNLEGKVVLPAGIRLLRSDSVELAGKLNLTLSYYNGHDDKALAAFPGGITGTVLENSSTNSGVFFPAGLLSLEITDSDWHKASIIENDSLEITMVV